MKKFKNLIVLIILWLLALAVIGFAFNGTSPSYEGTVTIEVSQGDTLWDIATVINDGSYNNNYLIQEIRNLNEVDCLFITAGTKLEVPAIKGGDRDERN